MFSGILDAFDIFSFDAFTAAFEPFIGLFRGPSVTMFVASTDASKREVKKIIKRAGVDAWSFAEGTDEDIGSDAVWVFFKVAKKHRAKARQALESEGIQPRGGIT